MDLAVNISETSYCMICNEMRVGCDCCFFIMIKSFKKRTEFGFPLTCYHRDEPITGTNHTSEVMDPFGKVPTKRKRRPWNEKTLRHIHIKYMGYFSDVIRFLASVQLRSPENRPQLGIIIDDIEHFLDDVCNAEESESMNDERKKFLGEWNHDARRHNASSTQRNTCISNDQAIKILHMRKFEIDEKFIVPFFSILHR